MIQKIKIIRPFILIAIGLLACTPQKKKNTKETPVEEKPVAKKFHPSKGFVEVMDPAFEKLIDKNAVVEVLAEGFKWTEGPVWVPGENYLLFSDIPNNKVVKWKEGEGTKSYLTPSGHSGEVDRTGETGSNGLMLNANGQLVLCQHTDRQLAIMNADLTAPKPSYVVLTGHFEGKRLNSPNDLDIHSNGDIYFTDPPYGLEKGMEDPAKELDFQGVYRWSSQDSTTNLLYQHLTRPNGIALSPDEKQAYVANSDPERAIWMVFDVNEDGSFSNERVFYDATQDVKKLPGLPDGMDVSKDGIIYATGPGGVWVFEPSGKLLGRIRTGQSTANCTIAADGYLYMTTDDYLTRIRIKKL
ncbi:SMP-30/gluconolactonase/LRE family protein [Fulvivirgaceae bacterium BMA10]|uniref:SMP-30/gluconolactonase/LRE family protein n=1 Tax=Splendidivirga corallicola TaxID=3051826 RepID=A0ABT8KU80_9BACT|nr:SMP-30/gluconolactonase/LRE family protein [Fulvivirgaceae bacterium BMA10]